MNGKIDNRIVLSEFVHNLRLLDAATLKFVSLIPVGARLLDDANTE